MTTFLESILLPRLRYIVSFCFILCAISIAEAQNCTVNAGVTQTICENDVFNLSGSTTGLVASGPVWSQVAGPSVQIMDPTDPNTQVNGMSGGNNYTFRLTATCDDSSEQFQDVVISVEPITIADAGIDIASCPDSSGSVIVTANNPVNPGETGIWSISGPNDGGVTINFPNSPSTTLTLSGTSAGTSTLRWTITGPDYGPGLFCESFDEISVTNYGGEEPVDAGPDQALDNCYTVSQSTSLNGSFGGNNINGQLGTWSFVSGPSTPTIADPNDNQSAVSDLIEGVYTFRWNVSGPCANGQDTVTITVDEATQDVTQVSVQDGNQVFCDAGVTTATLRANVAEYANETVQWVQTGGPAVALSSPTNSTTQVTGLASPNSYAFSYTITNTVTGCTSSATASIGYNPNAISIIANGGNDIIADCGITQVDVPFTIGGGGSNQYRLLSGPSDSSFTFPTAFQSFSDTSPLSLSFDEDGTYALLVRRSQSGQNLSGCVEATDLINISISGIPTAANAGTDQVLGCGITSTALTGNIVLQGNSLWTQVSGPNTAVFADPLARTTGISGLIPGEYIFRYTISGGPNCIPAESDVQVTVSATTNGPSNAGGDQTVCYGTPVALNANTPPGGQVGTWSQINGPDTIAFSDINDPQAIASGFATASSSYELQWTIDNPSAACGPAAADNVIINTGATEGPTTANAGPDQCLPSGTVTVNLAANTPAVDEQGLWTAVPSVGISFTDATQPNTTANITLEDSYILTWTISNIAPGCQDSADEVEISIGSPAAADAGPDQIICASVVPMAATSSTGDGLWTLVSGPGGFTIDDDTSPTTNINFVNSGIYIFDWTVNNGSCSTDTDQTTIEVGIPSTVATVGPPQTICNADNTVLSGNAFNPAIETGVWSVLSGAPNTPAFSDVNDPNANVTGLITGSYTFRWTITGDANCPSSFADVVIDVFSAANAGPDQDLCNATTVLLEATRGSTGTWTQQSGPPVTIIQSPADNYTASAAITPGNTYVFRFTTNYLSCPNLFDEVTITNSAPPSIAPDAGPDQLLCQADLIIPNTTTLAGNVAPGDIDTALWRFASEPAGSVAVIDAPNSNTSTLSGLTVPGIYILEWNFIKGNCTDAADVVRIEIFEAPSTAAAGPDQPNACQLEAQMNATPPAVGIGTWAFSVDPSGGAAVIDSPNSPTTTLSNITTLGTYTLTWTVSNGPFISPSACAPSIDTIDIIFTDIPASEANAGPDQELCDETQTTLDATPVGIGGGIWTQTAGAPATITAPTNPNSLITGLAVGTYEFTWTTNNNSSGCSFSDAVEIVIVEQPTGVDAGPDQELAQFAPVIMAATPASAGIGTWTQVSGPNTATFIDINDPSTSITGTTIGTYEFQWAIDNGICNEISDTVLVIINGLADLELTKSVAPTSVNSGDTVTFTIDILNNAVNSTVDATGISVKDIIPDGYTFVPGSASNGGFYNPGDFSLTWNSLSLPLGNNLLLSFQATVNATGTYLNSAEITDSDQADTDSIADNNDPLEDDQDSASVTLQSADLSLDKTVLPAAVSVGDTVTFTITVANDGPDDATGVQVTDLVPVGYTITTVNDGGIQSGNAIDWSGLSIAASNSINISFDAVVEAPTGASDEYLNTAEVTVADQQDPDSTPSNDDGDQSEDDEDNASITLETLDLELDISANPASGNEDDIITFTVSLFNNDASATGNGTGVGVRNPLPSGLELIGGTVSNGGSFDFGSNTITWTGLNIPNGTTLDLTYQARVKAPGVYDNIAEIIASDLSDIDSVPDNDDGDQSEDDEDIVVFDLLEADLELTKGISAASSATPNVGDTVVFELTLLNQGPDTATNVVVLDIIPSGYSVTIINNGGSSGGNFITWDIASIDPGAGNAITLSYEVTVLATGNYTNHAEIIFSDQFDPDSDPDTSFTLDDLSDGIADDDESSFTLSPQIADLELEVLLNDTTPDVGDLVTFTVNLSNLGPNAASNVSVENIVPPGFSGITNISGTGSAAGNTVTWNNLAVPVGNNTVTLTFDAVAQAPTGAVDEYLDVAQITASDQFDIDSSPNNDDGDQSEDDEDNIAASIPQADLSLVKTANTTQPNVGDSVTFTLTVTNAGPDVATGVAIEDVLPAGYTLTAVNNGGTLSGNTASWTGLSVPNFNGTSVVTYEATVNPPTGAIDEYLNNAQITASDQYDPDSDPTTDNTIDEDGNGDPDDDDEDQLTVAPKIADLRLTKFVVDNDITPFVETEISFEISVFNDGPDDATNVVVEDLLPAGYDFILYSATSGIYDYTTGIWSTGTVSTGDTQTLVIDVLVNTTGPYTNGAEIIAADVFDVDSTPNNNILAEDDQDEAVVNPIEVADLSLVKSVDNPTPDAGSNVVFTITVSNDGPSDATNIQVTDLLPSGYNYVSDDSGGNYVPATGIWSLGNLALGNSTTINITALVNPAGDYTNIAEITGADQADTDSTPSNDILSEDDQDEVVVVVRPVVDVSVTKIADNMSPQVGSTILFTITVTNDGPSDATNVVVTDLLASGYSFVSSTPSIGTYEPLNGSWTVGNLANGDSETLLLNADVLPAGLYRNTAELTDLSEFDIDSTPANNDDLEDDQESIDPMPVTNADLSLIKTVDDSAPLVGDLIEFTLQLSNAGPNDASGVIVADLLPSGYTYESHNATAGDYDPGTGIWDLNGIVFGGFTETLHIQVLVNPTGDYDNSAEITASDATDPDSAPGNNIPAEDDQDNQVTIPVAVANLSLDKTVDNEFPDVTQNVTFTLSLSNAGPSTATGITVSDLLPSGYNYLSDDGSGNYNNTTGDWTIASLAAGSSVALNITAGLNSSGNYANIAEVTTVNELDPNSSPGNNQSSEDDQDEQLTTPMLVTDLSITKTVDNLLPSVGDQLTFTITATNSGPSNATGVVIRDLLASGYAFVSSSVTAGTYDEVVGSWDLGTMANGAVETLNVMATVLPNGSYTNTAELIALDTFDPDSNPDNNLESEDDQSTINPVASGLADLSITKEVDIIRPRVGDTVAFTITLNNDGDSDATGVVISDLLAGGFTYISHETTIGSYNPDSGLWSTNGVIPNGSTEVLRILVTINEPSGQADEYLNRASVVASNQADPDSEAGVDETADDYSDGIEDDDEASVLVIVEETDLSLSKTVNNGQPRIGEVVDFTITVSNIGDTQATNIGIDEELPSGYAYVGSVVSTGTFDANDGFWSIPALAAGDDATLVLSVEVLEPEDYLNRASLAFLDQVDLNINNDVAEASVEPSCLHVYNEFSPNGDGVNEFFKIDCITRYPNNVLKIYNRWGNIVYEERGYNNDWNGISNGRAVVNATDRLPVGTYYYVLDLGDGTTPVSDWLYINR